jgi:hypothetical protein
MSAGGVAPAASIIVGSTSTRLIMARVVVPGFTFPGHADHERHADARVVEIPTSRTEIAPPDRR